MSDVSNLSSPAAPLPILFTHFGDQWIRGSETLLLDLLTHLDPARFRPIVWCNGVDMAEACRTAGFTTHRTDFAYYFDAGSPRFSPRTYAALVREGTALARQNGARVLHANSAAPTQWLLPVARTVRLPLLSHLHTAYMRRSRYALLVHQADLVVGVSAQVLGDPIRDGVPPERTKLIYNGVDFARLDAGSRIGLRSSLGIESSATVIGTAGSLVHRKGQDVLLHAIARCNKASVTCIPAPHLIVAGDGPEGDVLRRLADELGLSSRVHFIGHVRDMAAFYASIDVFALASRADAFGLVLAEAGFMRKPVVATRVGGIPEVVLDGETGLLVRPDDVEELAATLDRLMADPSLRARLGEAAHIRAETRFSVQRMIAEFSDTYEQLASMSARNLSWAAVPGRIRPYTRMFDRGAAA